MVFLALLGALAVADTPPDSPSGPPDFQVAFWYQRRDPLNTFSFQVYDVRKGEYNPVAVAAWLGRMAREYPGYKAYVHEVRVSPGEEPRRKVASVIIAEHILTGGPNGGFGLHSVPGVFSRGLDFGFMGQAPISRPFRSLPAVGGSPPTLPTIPYSFPFPYPYPRPHP
jgi:hypothetical protein